MQKRWLVNSPLEDELVADFRSELKVDRIVATLLLQRNIQSFDTAQSFFRPSITELHDPFLMKDMDRAVERLNNAILDNEKILLFG